MAFLLNIDSNAKTIKGQSKGYLTGILYLAPHGISGYNVCPDSTPGCRASCLYSAGRGFFNSVQNARIRRTKLFFEDPMRFQGLLIDDIEALVKQAKRKGLTPCVRLNGTSDIKWASMLFERFPGVQFYDYTKRPIIVGDSKDIPNYHVTFSYSGDNLTACLFVLQNKLANVSMVFRDTIPESISLDSLLYPTKGFIFGWENSTFPVIDGDKNDLRFTDQRGVVVGLKAKGKAKQDKTGFVV